MCLFLLSTWHSQMVFFSKCTCISVSIPFSFCCPCLFCHIYLFCRLYFVVFIFSRLLSSLCLFKMVASLGDRGGFPRFVFFLPCFLHLFHCRIRNMNTVKIGTLVSIHGLMSCYFCSWHVFLISSVMFHCLGYFFL